MWDKYYLIKKKEGIKMMLLIETNENEVTLYDVKRWKTSFRFLIVYYIDGSKSIFKLNEVLSVQEVK